MTLSYSEQQHYVLQAIKKLHDDLQRIPTKKDLKEVLPRVNPVLLFKTWQNALAAAGVIEQAPKIEKRNPKILVLDIETKPIKAWVWGTFDQNIGLDMIIEDWSVLSWAAKWIGREEIFYQDVSKQKDFKDDELIVRGIWELLNECDVALGQNSIRFDIPKLNGKFEEYGLGPPKPFKQIDTMRISKKLGLTSKKLAFMTEKFNEKHKKLKHAQFAGFSLWSECLNGNEAAWAELMEYNIADVLSTEELYLNTLQKWDSSINYGVYNGVNMCCPNCGSSDLEEKEYTFTKAAMFQSYQCKSCKTFSSGKQNLLDKKARKGLLK